MEAMSRMAATQDSALPRRPRVKQYLIWITTSVVALLSLVNLSLVPSLMVLATFLVNLFLSAAILGYFNSVRYLSFFVHLVACYIMFSVAPMLTYTSIGGFYSEMSSGDFIADQSLFYSNILTTIWIVIVSGGYWYFSRRPLFGGGFVIGVRGIYFQLIVGVFATAFVAVRAGVGNFTRASFEQSFLSQSAIEALFLEFPLRMASYYASAIVVYYYFSAKNILSKYFFMVLLLVVFAVLLFVNNPIAGSRFFTASVSIGFIYLLWLRRLESNSILFAIIVFGSILFFAGDFGRGEVTMEGAFYSFIDTFGIRGEFHDSFYAYESLPVALKFVDEFGDVWFQQLIGNLLAFIPRSVWETKPIGTGAMMAEAFGYAFTNVACSIVCEGYVNFGLMGILIFAVGFAYLLAVFDKFMFQHLNSERLLVAIVPLFVVGNIFFLTRGDLLSPLTFTISMVLGGLPMLLFIRKK